MSTTLDAARDLWSTFDAAAADAGDRVAAPSVAALREARLHTVMTPRDVGGQELPLTDCIDVFAEVSRADGSTGWCLIAWAGTIGFFGAWSGDPFARDLFDDGVPLAAGQFAPNGTATPDGEGYKVTGEYQFGSGIAEADWVGAGTLAGEDGGEIRFVLMPASDVQTKGNWDVLGLEATASWDYAVSDVWVPESATFDFFAPVRQRGGPGFDLGVLCLTAAGHAGVALGIGRRALDELIAIARDKHRMGAATPLRESDRFVGELATLESRYRSAAAWVAEAFRAADEEATTAAEDERPVDQEVVTVARQATVHATREIADIVRHCYLLSGTSGLRAGPLERAFRDIHAATQHFFAGDAATLDLGRDLLT